MRWDIRKLTGLIGGLLLVALFVFGNIGGRLSRGVMRPWMMMCYRLTGMPAAVSDWIDEASAKDAARIQELEEQVMALEIKTRELAAVQEENERLRRQMKLQPPYGWKAIHAEVIFRDPVLWDYGFTLDKGRQDGVMPGAVVLVEGQVAGRVSTVERHQCVVETVLSPTCRFSVTIGTSDRVGVIHGVVGTSASSPYRCQVDFLPLELDSESGLQVLTSGLGGFMPGGLPVGQIVPVDGVMFQQPDHARSAIYVQPYLSPDQVRSVTLFVKQNP